MVVDLSGYRTLTIHNLHQQYGSAVRVGPTEVSFSDIDSIKEVYGQQTTFMKAPIYETMSQAPLGIFSLRDKSLHSQRRKLLSHAFAQSNLQATEPLILQHVQRLLNRVQDNVSKPLDMLALFRLTAFDIVGIDTQAVCGWNLGLTVFDRRAFLGSRSWRPSGRQTTAIPA